MKYFIDLFGQIAIICLIMANLTNGMAIIELKEKVSDINFQLGELQKQANCLQDQVNPYHD